MSELALIDGIWRPAYDRDCVPIVLREVERIPDYLAFVPADRRGLVVQAGGNVGIWPQRLAAHFARVVTFEADPLNFRCLRRNVTADNVEAWPCGLWSRATVGRTVNPAGEEANCGAVQVRLDPDASLVLLPLDHLVAGRVDLLLLDIEGAELQALFGAAEILTEDRPVVALEIKGLGRSFGLDDDSIFRLMADHRYAEAGRIGRDVIFAPC